MDVTLVLLSDSSSSCLPALMSSRLTIDLPLDVGLKNSFALMLINVSAACLKLTHTVNSIFKLSSLLPYAQQLQGSIGNEILRLDPTMLLQICIALIVLNQVHI